VLDAMRSRLVLTPSTLAQPSRVGCVIMIMYEVSTSARRSNSTHSLITGQLSPGCPNRITAGRHKVEQTLINNTVTVKEHHVPLQS
jgi:hypothetical protein